jgi:hypothetical membrane protein
MDVLDADEQSPLLRHSSLMVAATVLLVMVALTLITIFPAHKKYLFPEKCA